METINFNWARNNLAKTIAKVYDDHAPVIITRKNQQHVVMISLEDYQALEETAYLLCNLRNAQRLLKSILELEGNEN